MEFVGIEKQLFEELVHKFEYFEHRVMEICNRENDRTQHKWMDNQPQDYATRNRGNGS